MPQKKAGHKSNGAAPATAPKHHYDKLFWADLEGDLALKDCSMAAQGFWVVRMLPICARAKRRGYFLHNGKPPTLAQLAKWSGQDPDDIAAWIAELGEKGVFSRDAEGVIYCRRMEREANKTAPAPSEKELAEQAIQAHIEEQNRLEERRAKQRARQARYMARKRNKLTRADAPADVSDGVIMTSAGPKMTRQRVSKNVREDETPQGVDAENGLPGSHKPLAINQSSCSQHEADAGATPRTPATLTGGVRGKGAKVLMQAPSESDEAYAARVAAALEVRP